MDARSEWLNSANFNGLEILCPKEAHACNFLHGLLHLRTDALANVKAKRRLEECQIATFANTGGNMTNEDF